MECAQSPVGSAGDIEFSTLNLVIMQDPIQKFREDRIGSAFEEEMIRRSDRTHDDVAARFSFRKPVSLEHIVDGIEILAAAGKRKNSGIGASGIVGVG